MNRKITIFDTTLRDGEQTPGVVLTFDHKIEIAAQLDKLGVDMIEAGFPIASQDDKKSVKTISDQGFNFEVCGLARSVFKDIDACLDCNVDIVHVFIPTSDVQRENTIKKTREQVVEIASNSVQYIKDHGTKCMFSPMDATRTDLNYLIEITKAVERAGCDIINIPDTVGVMTPSGMYNLIEKIRPETKMPIDVHCHNDFGLAVGNSIMAVEAGANQVQVTINGIGERAGNASLTETAMALKSIYNLDLNIKTEYLSETARMIETYSGIKLAPNTPLIGENAFAHESGIHTQGVLENSETFEPGIVTPEMVGSTRRIVLGKHAGKHAVKESLYSAGIDVSDAELEIIVQKVKKIADKGKRITDVDLYSIASTIVGKKKQGEDLIKLKEVSVMTGNVITPTAVIKASIKGKEMVAASAGIGPIDAAVNAVHEILSDTKKFKLDEFNIEAISGGADAIAEVRVGIKNEIGKLVTAKSSHPDIVMASVEALVDAMNTLSRMPKNNTKN